MSPVDGASRLAGWLMDVARACGEPSLDRALTSEWPGTPEQRRLLAPGHIEAARNEARQIANWRKEDIAKGLWGV
jgi:hypothetical protein